MNELLITQAVSHILKYEGGFVNHPADVGGPTNYGITMPTLTRWIGRQATYEDIKNLDIDTAKAIYRQFFILDMPYARVKDAWSFLYIVDMGVLHKPKSLAKIVQKAAHAKVDGIFGERTLAAVNELSSMEATRDSWKTALRRERIYHYIRRVRNDPTQSVFLLGWVKRAFAL